MKKKAKEKKPSFRRAKNPPKPKKVLYKDMSFLEKVNHDITKVAEKHNVCVSGVVISKLDAEPLTIIYKPSELKMGSAGLERMSGLHSILIGNINAIAQQEYAAEQQAKTLKSIGRK